MIHPALAPHWSDDMTIEELEALASVEMRQIGRRAFPAFTPSEALARAALVRPLKERLPLSRTPHARRPRGE